jgi:hypothetical protein
MHASDSGSSTACRDTLAALATLQQKGVSWPAGWLLCGRLAVGLTFTRCNNGCICVPVNPSHSPTTPPSSAPAQAKQNYRSRRAGPAAPQQGELAIESSHERWC